MTMLSVTIPVSGCQEAQDSLPVRLLLIFMPLQMTPPRSFPFASVIHQPWPQHSSDLGNHCCPGFGPWMASRHRGTLGQVTKHQPCIPCRFPSNPARFVQPSVLPL